VARAPSRLKGWLRRRWRGLLAGFLFGVAVILAFVYRDDILQTALDPREPFQTYQPPPAPDYNRVSGWALWPGAIKPGDGPADVFFVHPTTYNGGEEWVGPIDQPYASRYLDEVMLPNYAGPFLKAGRVFAPRYRQASLYTLLTPREDAREARRFAYDDVRRAFRRFVQASPDRPILLVGVEQGGSIADRLLREEIAPNPGLRARLAGAWLIQAQAPAAPYGSGAPIPACARRDQSGCVVAYLTAPEGDEARARRIQQRALVWQGDRLEPLAGARLLCVNPLLGAATEGEAGRAANLGAVNASNLEWGLRPGFLPHQVSARCKDGILRVSKAPSPTLKPARGWVNRLKAPRFNVFWADLEADALARVGAWQHRSSPVAKTTGEVAGRAAS
jgi:hypothetical protein